MMRYEINLLKIIKYSEIAFKKYMFFLKDNKRDKIILLKEMLNIINKSKNDYLEYFFRNNDKDVAVELICEELVLFINGQSSLYKSNQVGESLQRKTYKIIGEEEYGYEDIKRIENDLTAIIGSKIFRHAIRTKLINVSKKSEISI